MSDGEQIGNIRRDLGARFARRGQQRFVGGWQLLDTDVKITLPPWLHAPRTPDLTVDVIRGRDLVALSVAFYGAKLDTDGELPRVVRKGSGSHLMVVTFPFQHGFEQAQYVTEGGEELVPNDADPTHPMAGAKPPDAVTGLPAPGLPVGFFPARASRLVFAIGPQDAVEFTRAGILRAMRELTPVLHPNAEPPGLRGSIDTAVDQPPRFTWIAPDLVARFDGAQVLVDRPTAAERRSAPDAASTSGALQFAQGIREFRVAAATLPARRAAGLSARATLPEAIIGALERIPDLTAVLPKYSSKPTEHRRLRAVEPGAQRLRAGAARAHRHRQPSR